MAFFETMRHLVVRLSKSAAPALCSFLALSTSSAADQPPRAAIVCDLSSEPERLLGDAIVKRFSSSQWNATLEDFSALVDGGLAEASGLELLVLPNASRLPGESVEPIHHFLEHGGDIIALNTPMWRSILVGDGKQWRDRATFIANNAGELLQHTVIDFSSSNLAEWRRAADNPSLAAVHELVDTGGDHGEKALHVQIPRFGAWDTFVSPPLPSPFPPGNELTAFYAKGSANTNQLSLEWTEKDGSRWIAVTPLTTDWKLYVLQPSDFRYWESAPQRSSDAFHPENADHLCVGLALTHTRVNAGPHEYWLGRIGTASRAPEHNTALAAYKIPTFETLSPGYKFFDVSGATQLCSNNAATSSLVPFPNRSMGMHPRPSAGGFDKKRDWRWEPLLTLGTEAGEWRGNPAALILHSEGQYRGGVWASFAIDDMAWYQTDAALDLIAATAERMRRGVFLIDAGADKYTYFSDQDIRLGARVVSLASPNPVSVDLRIMLTNSQGNILADVAQSVDLSPLDVKTIERTLPPLDWAQGPVSVDTTIYDKSGACLDRASHEIYVWRPKSPPSFVSVQNGDFLFNGQRWRPHGVNYMPSSGVATEDGEYFEYWIDTKSYDPDIVERDLQHIHDMGLNAVSIFLYRRSMESQNLLDLLRRLDEHSMKANLSLRPGTPLEFEWDAIREMIEYYRLAQNDTVFAYDLAWEPMFGNQKERRPYDKQWRAWIAERYGSIENAEHDWAYSAPRDEAGNVTNPPGEWHTKDGPWRILVAAYRRFLDTLLYENYSRARTLVRSIDPNHLVSFRMTEAGDPTYRGDRHIPYGWSYLAGAVDIFEPEAYGRIGDWEKVKPGIFEHSYARHVRPEIPMIWAEAGVSTWAQTEMRATESALKFQGDYYKNLYRMFIESACDGVFFWWYPGGYRTNEKSDYGIVNPDGSDRPVTKVIREHADVFINGPDVKAPDLWLDIDLDAHPDGLAGVYDETKAAYWAAIESEKVPGLRTLGTATTSATCPQVAVGNTPLTGANPPKYLDAFIDGVQVETSRGSWQDVHQDDSLDVQGGSLRLRITFTNLGEATLLAPGTEPREGAVFLVVTIGQMQQRIPLPKDMKQFEQVENMAADISQFSSSGKKDISIRFTAVGVTDFGPRYRFTIN